MSFSTPVASNRIVGRTLLLLLMALLLESPAFALEPIGLVGPPTHPNYLVPVNPQAREYQKAIEDLLAGRWGDGTMIYANSPYTGRDFAVSVWNRGSLNEESESANRCFITLVEISPGERGQAIKKRDINVPIDTEFAVAAQRAWANMLLKTRFPTSRYLGADGCQTEFSVWIRGLGGVYGQLWCPSEGLPKELMEIGFALADYCNTPESERDEKRKKLILRLNDFATSAAAST